MRTVKEKMTDKVGNYRKALDDLQADIITDIWNIVRTQPDESLDITEIRGCPAIVTMGIDDQESETIFEVKTLGNKVIAVAGVYEDDNEYDLDKFDVPMLIDIFESVVKHTK